MSTRSLTVAQYEALKKSYASAEDMFIGHQNAEDYVFAPSPYSQYAFGAFETDSASTQKVFCILGQIRFVERYHSFNEQMKFP